MASDPFFQLSVSTNVFDYLTWLAKNTLLGRDEKEVARNVLTDKLIEMKLSGYREPPPGERLTDAKPQS